MKLFCLTVQKDFEEDQISFVIAENEAEAEEKITQEIIAYENSELTEGEEPCTIEYIDSTYSIRNTEEIPNEIDGYKITLTKI